MMAVCKRRADIGSDGDQRLFTAPGVACMIIALYFKNARHSFHVSRFLCLGRYADFFDRSGFSSLFVCLEHGIICQMLPAFLSALGPSLFQAMVSPA